MSDQTPSAEQSVFEEAIAYLDSLPPGELERRIAEQDSAAERWPYLPAVSTIDTTATPAPTAARNNGGSE